MTKVFDDYEVNCNECQSYWDSSCDGVPIEKKRNCTAYKATRTVDIPMQIERLSNAVKGLQWSISIAAILIGYLLVKL